MISPQERKTQSLGNSRTQYGAHELHINPPPMVSIRTKNVGVVLLVLLFVGTGNDPLRSIRWLEC
jgi:hypothetical protein